MDTYVYLAYQLTKESPKERIMIKHLN